MPKCLFCEQTANSKEHVWPGWMSRLFYPQRRKGQVRALQTRSVKGEETSRRSWAADSINLTVRITCEDCNSGWMSRLEDFVKPSLAPLVLNKGHRTTLDLDDQAALVAWCFKAALVFEHTAETQFYSPSDHLAFAKLFTPIEGSFIWIAQYKGKRRTHSSIDNLFVEDGGKKRHLQVVTVMVGHFACQIASAHWEVHVPRDLDTEAGTSWRPSYIQLWPTADRSIRWPPPKYLTDKTLEPFCDRFRHGVVVFR